MERNARSKLGSRLTPPASLLFAHLQGLRPLANACRRPRCRPPEETSRSGLLDWPGIAQPDNDRSQSSAEAALKIELRDGTTKF